MKYLLSLILLAFLSCTPTVETKPLQAEATAIVWQQTYHHTAKPPQVTWVEGSALNCAGGRGWLAPVTTPDGGVGECVGGLYDPASNTAQVAWLGNYHESAFAHELGHSAETLAGIYDPNHTSIYFQPNGGLVQIANQTLQNDNL